MYYKACVRHGWLDEICKHLERTYRVFDEAILSEIAASCETRAEFQKKDASAYQAARRRKILDKICQHMEKGEHTGFNRSRWVECYPNGSYIYAISLGGNYCKVGITGSGIKSRISTIPYECKVLLYKFCENSELVYNKEKEILRTLRRVYDLCKDKGFRGSSETFATDYPDSFAKVVDFYLGEEFIKKDPEE